MRLLIVRHGDPDYTAPDGGTVTPAGAAEAEALAVRFKRTLPPCAPEPCPKNAVTRLYSSPMGRARHTAAPTEKALGLTAEIEEWTRELSHWPRMGGGSGGPDGDGKAKPGEGGMAVWDTPGEQLKAYQPPLDHESQWERVPDMKQDGVRDLYNELCANSDKFLARHGYVREPDTGRYRVVGRNRDTIVVFCHGGFCITWLSHLLQIPVAQIWGSFWTAPSSVTTILFEERSRDFATPRALCVGDTSHLEQAGLDIALSRFEKPNAISSEKRPSGIKSNFY